MGFPLTDQLTASVPGQTSQVQAIQVVARGNTHQTGTSISCVGATPPGGAVYARPNRFFPVQSDDAVSVGLGQPITCTAYVMDLDSNTAFDGAPAYGGFCAGPYTVTHCNVDYQRAAASIGQVTFTPSGGGMVAQQCTLTGRANGPPAGVPVHPWGAWFYASWCRVTLTPTISGTWQLAVAYAGAPGDSGSDPTVPFFPGNPASSMLQVAVS
jgi:hypothetical protein